MPTINQILDNLNNKYSEITTLIPNLYRFTDDFISGIDEYDVLCSRAPLGDNLLRLSSGKLLWCGISGGQNIGGYNIKRFNSDYSRDTTWGPIIFDDDGTGGYVRDIAEQGDGKIIAVGHFTSVNEGTNVGRILRLSPNGVFDSTFNIGGVGFDANAFVVKVLDDDSILVGGSFNAYSGSSSPAIIKLNSDGTIDGSFTSSLSTNVYCLAVASNGDIYAGGDFAGGIVRLNSDGTIDAGFNVGGGFNNRVSDIVIDSNGKIIVGGWFTNYDGTSVPQVVRLETNGDLDVSFNLDGNFASDGNNESVQCLALQSNGKIVVGGWFWTLNGNLQRKLVRLNTNGTKDETFNTGNGFNVLSDWWNDAAGSRINRILVNNDGSILVTGNIQSYQNTPINGFAKLSSTGSLHENIRIHKYKKIFGIDDGSNDMYDDGNAINTNLTQLYDNIKENNVDWILNIPYTHTTGNDRDAFIDIEDSEVSTYEPLKDGEIKDGSEYFGAGSSYFTNMYPGMFILAAKDIDIEEFSITGDVGSDSNTYLETAEVQINGSQYACFMKTNIEGNPITVTSDISLDTLNLNGHGLLNDAPLVFDDLGDTSGVSLATVYYIVNSTANDFQISTSIGGDPVDLTGLNSNMIIGMSTNDDPTVNHIILVPGSLTGLTHLANADEDDYDDDCVQGLSGRDHLYYILFSTKTNPTTRVTFNTCQAIAEKFLEVISSVVVVEETSMAITPTPANKCVGRYGDGSPNRKLYCFKGNDNNGDPILTCAGWRKFGVNCPKGNLQCNRLSEAWVAAITVCNQRLF